MIDNFDGLIDLILIIFSIGVFISILMLDKESEKNAERIVQTDKKYYQLADFFSIHGCDIDELQKVCTSLIAQNKEQEAQIKKLEKKVKKLEKELKK